MRPGGRIIVHPDGVAAGVAAFREAWETAMAGETLEDVAASSPVLAAARDTVA